MSKQSQSERIQRRLRIVQWSALLDLILLVMLIASALTGRRDFVHVLGPLHGINFLLLIVIAATAALDGLWSWWFPVAILLTAGPPGALIGEWIIKQRISAQSKAETGNLNRTGHMPSAPDKLSAEGDKVEKHKERV